MKAYKGFKGDMTCRGFQYEEGKTYETDSAVLCEKGFHACENPLEVFEYYPPCDESGNLNKFHEVELEGVSKERFSGTKVVAKKIKIGKELNFNEIAKAHIEWVKSSLDKDNEIVNSGDRSIAVNRGYRSSAVNSGYSSIAVNSGYSSIAVNSGKWSIAVNSGDGSAAINRGFKSIAMNRGNGSSAVNIGYKSCAINNGNGSTASNIGNFSNSINDGERSIAVNCGFKSSAVNSGFMSCALNSGENSSAMSSGYKSSAINNGNGSVAITLGSLSSAINNGKDSIAVAWGVEDKAKAEKGSYIVLAEWVFNEERSEYVFKGAKMRKVDGKKIKANTFYKLENGKFVEVK